MAWCPKCNDNYPIVTSVKGSSYGVPVTTERYSSEGKYIGYEESETYTTDIETHPRCSNCYSVFEFPNVTSKEEYFRTIQKKLIEEWRARKPNELESFAGAYVLMGVFGGLLVGVIAHFILKQHSPSVVSIIIGLIAAVGLGVYGFRSGKSDYSERRKKYENRLKEWERKLNELQAMEYSDKNYKKLIERQKEEEGPRKEVEKLLSQEVLTKEDLKRLGEARKKLPEEEGNYYTRQLSMKIATRKIKVRF